MEKDADAEEYQGHSYTWVAVDEITNWATPRAINKLRATLRSAAGVECVFRGTGNPGGPGHNWVKTEYVDPVPAWHKHAKEIKLDDGTVALSWKVYIPSRLEHNRKLMESDPLYWQRIAESVADNPALLNAWRWGRWDIVSGGMFDDLWRADVHVIPPFQIPPSWYIDRSFDWGSSDPFSCLWWAESDGTQVADGRCWPRGTLFLVAEWYGWNGKPNEGLRMIDTEIAKGIIKIEKDLQETYLRGHKIHHGPADLPAAENGVSVADDMGRFNIWWDKPEKFSGSRVTGWKQLRKRLKASLQRPMEDPGIFIFENNRQWIRTVPVLPMDESNPDDVDTEAEDHAGDATRYRLMREKSEIKAKKLKGF